LLESAGAGGQHLVRVAFEQPSMDFEDQFLEIPVFEVFVHSSSSSSDNRSVVTVGRNPKSAFVLHQIGEGGRGAFRSGGVDGIQTREQAANRPFFVENG
jgi:hypothetical protein